MRGSIPRPTGRYEAIASRPQGRPVGRGSPLSVALLVLALTACGLPSAQSLLLPPALPSIGYLAADNGVFQFVNQAQDVGNVQSAGFELFYKLYNYSADPTETAYNQDIAQMNNAFASVTPPTSVPNYLTSTLGYRRLVQVPSGYLGRTSTSPDLTAAQFGAVNTVPLIPITPSGMAFAFTVSLSFANIISSSPSQTQNAYPPVTSSSPTFSIPIARLLPDPNNPGSYILAGFGQSDFYTGDPDLPPSFLSGQALLLSLVAVAYSNNLVASPPQTSYSVPLALTNVIYPIIRLQ